MTWRVEFDHNTAWIYGPKAEARRRLVACGDSFPIWVQRREAWGTSIRAANALLDQLEARNIRVTVENADQVVLDLRETTPANVDRTERQGEIW